MKPTFRSIAALVAFLAVAACTAANVTQHRSYEGGKLPQLGRVSTDHVSASPSNGGQPAAASADAFHDPVSTQWYFGYGLSGSEFESAWEASKNQGFVPIDIEVDRTGDGLRYSGVWQKNEDGRRWVGYRYLTGDAFQQKSEEYKGKGYRLIDQEAAVIDGSLRYSLIMVENREGLKWVSNRNLTSGQFAEKLDQLKADYLPIDFDAVSVNGERRYSAIWMENKATLDWAMVRDLTPEAFGQKSKQYSDQGYRVAKLDCYANESGAPRYAAIWEKNKPGRAWAARREISAKELMNWWKKHADQGMRVVDIAICPSKAGGGVEYVAVWRENDGRYDWTGRISVENELKKYVDNSNAPSVGVAIMRNGELLFRGGAGNADTQDGVWAHGGTIYRLASVAKAVTGTIAYDMEEAGLIDLDNRTATIVSGLGSQHTHTVRQLLRMEGCAFHYKKSGTENATQAGYATARSALDGHLTGNIKTNNWIVPGCALGQYRYSTHGYVLVAAALEAKGGMPFADLVKSRISDPMNLHTLRVESRATPDPSGELAEVYADGARVSGANFQNVTWKAPSGGMESSAVDLGRFGDAVLRNRYFPQATREAMWLNGTRNGRASGWTVNGAQRWKTGAQQGSDAYIVVDTNTGVTVVTLTNVRSPSIDTTVLANTLLGIANAN